MLDRRAEPWELPERYCWIHVVFQVILHVPIVESGGPGTGEGPRVVAKVRNVRVQCKVLGDSAEESQPATVLCAESEDDDEKRVTGRNEEHSKRTVTGNEQSVPVPVLPPQCGF